VGFILFYGSVVLKIYRNLQEYRVRKAHHVFVREQDLLKYLAVLTGFTILGLLAWSFGSTHNDELWESAWPRCPVQKGVAFWSVAELVFLLYGMRLCYKAHRSSWVERYQFSLAVVFEAFWTCVFTIWRYIIRDSGSEDALFFLFIAQLHLTVSANIAAIIAPKFVFVSITAQTFGHRVLIKVTSDNNRRTLAMAGGGSSSGRAHPSLAKLRDNLINGTTDFAEIPIVDMNPEDIRAELKRVYTQLRMYKLKNLYQDNPHVSKRKGGKKTSDKTTKNRRISIPPTSSSPKARRLDEEEEKSDLTVESAPHNVYLSTNKIQLDSADQSVRV
jgi:G protein-coupled receptor 158